MTTLAPVAAPPVQAAKAPARAAGLRLWLRLTRRGTLLLWLGVAAYMAMELLSYRSAYPDAASRQQLLEVSGATAVRMLQGVPGAVDTPGGFAVWDGGWMLSLIIACWALLTATRLTRGEDDSGRVELVLSRPVAARQALTAQLGAMGVALAGVAVAAAIPFLVLGEPVQGALLWGAGVGALGAVFAALGALCAQLTEPRRRALALGFSVTAALFLLRVVANSADSRAWLLNGSPFGWLDRISAFTDDRWLQLLPPLVAAVLLGTAAVALRARRDVGAALTRSAVSRRPRLHLLGGPNAFGWRLTSGALLGWSVSLVVSSLVFGLMVGPLIDFITEDASYRRMLESMGVDMSSPVAGFLSYIAVFLALPFATFVVWRLGAARQEEADGRLDNILVRGVVRWRWLAVTTALAFVAALLVVIASGAALWAGAELAYGGVPVSQVAEPLAGTIPLVLLFMGLTVLVFGLAPRLTVAVPAGLAVVTYLLDTFGELLDWPDAVMALSPFHHLARLPADPMALSAAALMTAAGLVAAVAGIAVFSRRDLRGA